MKQDGIGIARLVAVILIPELGAIVARLHEFCQFGAKHFYLPVVEEPNSRQKTVLVKLLDLPRADLQGLPLRERLRLREKVAHRGVKLR
jgi:hypothetical protein